MAEAPLAALAGTGARMRVVTNSPEETIAFARNFAKLLRAGDVVAFRGGLGAGKTTFTRGLSLGLGLGDNVTSPTFALVNEYRPKGGGAGLFHFDLYRLSSAEDAETTGYYDYLAEGGICAVEWSENAAALFGAGTVFVELLVLDESRREIRIYGDERFADHRD
ncbi:MAG: tRNA (adenosine(37)-N6)-threonylcarbamoyltransferase complex ATPase subunit type 1 TsaE [Oscillospiraceae bacterium]